jgi:hypothetical protein
MRPHVYFLPVMVVDKKQGAARLVDVKQNLARKSIDQLGYAKNINSLIVLSGTLV